MNVDIIDEHRCLTNEQKKMLANVLKHAYMNERLTNNLEVVLSIVTDDTIQQLNDQFRNKKEVTDVLSFPLHERAEIEDGINDYPLAIGDIIIAYGRAKEQAEAYGHSLERELAFLAVHGFLHLIGYTHDTAEEEKKMFAKQEKVLKELELER